MPPHVIRHADQTLDPDPERVVARLFMPSADPGHGNLAPDLVARVMALDEAEVERLAGDVVARFALHHGTLRQTLLQHAHPLTPRGEHISDARAVVLGAVFTAEFSLEGAALCNPSAVPHPDQSGLGPDELRVALSLRAIGEGHVSSIEFASGVVGDDGWRFEPRSGPPVLGTITPAALPWELIAALTGAAGEGGELTTAVLGRLPERIRAQDVDQAFDDLPPDLLLHPASHRQAEALRRASRSAYYTAFDPRTRLDQRVLMPAVDDESHGLEDARFTLFTDEEGSTQYRATYTAYNGRDIQVRMLTSADLTSFQSTPLAGVAATNKGMAIFPRLIGGRFAALTRHDGARNGVSFSADGLTWDDPTVIEEPGGAPWMIRQLGNSGAPVEIDEGWLVLTHGVGPMRVYSLGALLLDRDDPTRVIARLEEPWLTPHPHHGGYVPNVVFSCGGLVHRRRLFVPHGIGDQRIAVASVAVDDLVAAMRPEPQPSRRA
ncbi:hypothetical protein [Propioniciclava soli]|uniref:Glycosylase n=1 Tax=Propioniciclava soli TaxID=2775081 RepID=A0ABZ3CAV3_9ACTN|nr:hypothetical protein [Propioniciclava soli]